MEVGGEGGRKEQRPIVAPRWRGGKKGGLGRGEEVKEEVKVAFYTRFVMGGERKRKRVK